MGTYLSTPVTEKHKEEGTSKSAAAAAEVGGGPLSWGVVDMQGWRNSMEDAHVAQTDVPLPSVPVKSKSTATQTTIAHIFGVFDGHGGPEVARFAALYMVSVLDYYYATASAAGLPAAVAEPVSGTVAATNSAAGTPHIPTLLGPALVQSFHALDRMIDDPTRKDELIRLRAAPPAVAEQRAVSFIPPPKRATTTSTDANALATSEATNTTTSLSTIASGVHNPEEDEQPELSNNHLEELDAAGVVVVSENNSDAPEDDENSLEPKGKQEAADLDQDISSSDEDEEQDSQKATNTEKVNNVAGALLLEDPLTTMATTEPPRLGANDTQQQPEQTLVVSSSTPDTANNSSSTAGRVSGMFQRLMKLSQPSTNNNNNNGGVVLSVGKHGNIIARSTGPPPNAAKPTVVRNGQMMCNLPDHRVHAGATAVVAVLCCTTTTTTTPNTAATDNTDTNPSSSSPVVCQTRTLTVANAGDSRAVLCRAGGVTVPMSFDHKPMQATELARIRASGGFVNAFGRVNGNLNLSRSLGDLKYKQVPGIGPAEQMITAEPDILECVSLLLCEIAGCVLLFVCLVPIPVSCFQIYSTDFMLCFRILQCRRYQMDCNRVTLNDNDEFIILGCDGIWDCLTNEKAVEFVRSRLPNQTPTEIGVEMLQTIISADPRVSQGIGGDNMTIMIVDLQPTQRSYYNNTNDNAEDRGTTTAGAAAKVFAKAGATPRSK